VNQSTHFEKHLRNLRPGYDWEPAQPQDSQQQQQQSSVGTWRRRAIGGELLEKCNMDPDEIEVGRHRGCYY
jgi:hypothetical protein